MNGEVAAPSQREVVARAPRATTPLADIVGMDDAKAVLQEGVIQPLKMAEADDAARLFWRSSGQSAVLLSNPDAVSSAAAAEAAAAAAGAQVIQLTASDAVSVDFCRTAIAAASRKPVLVIVELLETAPTAALVIRSCLRDAVAAEGPVAKLAVVATSSSEPSKYLQAAELSAFGYKVQVAMPNKVERKQFLMKLLAQVSRVDASWGSSLRESAFDTLANLTFTYTFSEIDFIVRRAFLKSANPEGGRDPVALHHFEKIIAVTPPASAKFFNLAPAPRAAAVAVETGEEDGSKKTEDKKKKKKGDAKDPMDSIFGWCNFWLPESLHLPPVVWAMICFGLLAHLMARTTYQPQGNRKRRSGGNNSLFRDGMGGPGMGGMGGFGGDFGDGFGGLTGPSPFGNFPPPPGMPGLGGNLFGPPGADGGGAGTAASADGAGGSAPAEAKSDS